MLPLTVDRRKKVDIRGGRGSGELPKPRSKNIAKNIVSKTEKKFMAMCPRGCRKSAKTFDTRTQECRNCGFKKLPKDAKVHGPGFKKASELT
jgi:ribosomal protein L37E